MTRLRADLLLLLAAGIWGLAFIFQKTAMASIGPFTFIAARATLATVALLPLAVFEYRRLPITDAAPDRLPPALLYASFVAGLAFVTGAALQQFGLLTATATNAGFLTALYVVLTPPLAYLMRGTRPKPALIPAILLSAFGTWLLGGGAFSALSQGDWLIAFCAVFWALHVILSQNGARFNRPILFTGLQFAVVAAVAAVGAALFETVSFSALRAAAGEIAYVGLLSSALTFTILTMALRYAPASEAAVIVSTESVFAALAGALLLHERLPPLAWIGCGLILAAVLLVQLAPRAAAQDPK
jgi:drug/metabolite transporter (DMT)-like permease